MKIKTNTLTFYRQEDRGFRTKDKKAYICSSGLQMLTGLDTSRLLKFLLVINDAPFPNATRAELQASNWPETFDSIIRVGGHMQRIHNGLINKMIRINPNTDVPIYYTVIILG